MVILLVIFFSLSVAQAIASNSLPRRPVIKNRLSIAVIYKILTPAEWQDFQKEGYFKGSSLDQKDGFIHAAFEDQYPNIIKKFFAGRRPLILVKLDVKLLATGCLKIEANQPGGNKYPHLYGEIPFKAVISHEVLN